MRRTVSLFTSLSCSTKNFSCKKKLWVGVVVSINEFWLFDLVARAPFQNFRIKYSPSRIKLYTTAQHNMTWHDMTIQIIQIHFWNNSSNSQIFFQKKFFILYERDVKRETVRHMQEFVNSLSSLFAISAAFTADSVSLWTGWEKKSEIMKIQYFDRDREKEREREWN